MAELFDCSTDNISLHLRNIFKEQELYKNSATEDFSLVVNNNKNKAIILKWQVFPVVWFRGI